MDWALLISLKYQGCLNEIWGLNKGGCGRKQIMLWCRWGFCFSSGGKYRSQGK
jgi:hypothetical protein